MCLCYSQSISDNKPHRKRENVWIECLIQIKVSFNNSSASSRFPVNYICVGSLSRIMSLPTSNQETLVNDIVTGLSCILNCGLPQTNPD